MYFDIFKNTVTLTETGKIDIENRFVKERV